MPIPLTLVTHTPPFVWAVLAYLVWQGMQSLRTRRRSLWRLVAAPLVFAAWAVATMPRSGGEATFVPWFAAALAAAALGALTVPRILASGPGRLVVTAGSPVPLVRNMLVFGAHSALGVAAALHLMTPDALADIGGVISGAMVGYVAGWIPGLYRGYRGASAPQSVSTSAQ